MKRGLTQKQLLKGVRRIEDTKEFLHDSINNYLQYKRATKGWHSCTNSTNETKAMLYQEIIDIRLDLASLQRKYL